ETGDPERHAIAAKYALAVLDKSQNSLDDRLIDKARRYAVQHVQAYRKAGHSSPSSRFADAHYQRLQKSAGLPDADDDEEMGKAVPYGHTAYQRKDPRTGKLVSVEARGVKPAQTEKQPNPKRAEEAPKLAVPDKKPEISGRLPQIARRQEPSS